jgi:hypothetical protein
MSLTTPPETVTVDQPLQIPYPTNSPWESVVVSNLSGYLLEVQASGQTSWLEPFTAMLYSISGTHNPVVVTPQLLAGSSATSAPGQQVQATWYAPGESPQGTWPVSLTSEAITAGIAGAGLAGASNGVQTLYTTSIAPGGQETITPGEQFSLWNWGWSIVDYGNPNPTAGNMFMFAAGAEGGVDNLMWDEGASNRLAGLQIPATGITFQNFLNEPVLAFMVFSE